MIVNDEFLKKLRSAFDLNIYEAKIWAALLSKGVASAGELSDISDVPRSRSYDVLESLEKRGFVVMKLGKPIKYIAVKPEEVIRRVKKQILDVANTQVKVLDNLEDAEVFNELNLLYKNGINHIDPATISGAIRGRRNIYDQMSSMVENAQKSVTIVTTVTGLIRKNDHLESVLKKLNSKGIKVRIAAPINNDNIKSAKALNSVAEVRKTSNVGARFVLVDSKEIMFMINNDDKVHESYDIGIWVNSPFFAGAVDSLFNMNWDKLEKIE